MCEGVRSRVCQEHAFGEVVGKAGVVAGAASAASAAAGLRSGPWGFDRRVLLGLAQLLDQKTLVTALLGIDSRSPFW